MSELFRQQYSIPQNPEVEEAIGLIHLLHKDPKYVQAFMQILESYGNYLDDTFPEYDISHQGRIKSTMSAYKNLTELHQSVDKYDYIGFKTVVKGVNIDYSPEDPLIELYQTLHSLDSPILTQLKETIERIIHSRELRNSVDINNPEYLWDSFYNFEEAYRTARGQELITRYSNPDVLLVDRLNIEIERLRNNFNSPIPSKLTERIIFLMKQSQEATTYGASLIVSEHSRKYFKSQHGIIFLDDRQKSKLKNNGYASEHYTAENTSVGLDDGLISVPFEGQITCLENDLIARYGSAAHTKIPGKERRLPHIDYPRHLPDNLKLKEFFHVFSPKFFKEILWTVPEGFVYSNRDKDGNRIKGRSHLFTQYQNFTSHYEDTLKGMSTEQNYLYYIFTELCPELRHLDRRKDHYLMSEFPYTVIPQVIEEADRREKEENVR